MDKNGGPDKYKWILMGAVALFFDFLQVLIGFITPIPYVGQVLGIFLGFLVSMFAWMTLGLWMKIYNVNIFTKSTVVMSIFELIPMLNTLPTFTGIVVKRYLDVKTKHLQKQATIKPPVKTKK